MAYSDPAEFGGAAVQQPHPYSDPAEFGGTQAQAPQRPGVLARAASNIPASTANFASSIAGAIVHPINTASTVLDVAAGGLQRGVQALGGDAIVKALDSPNAERARERAGAVGEYFKQRYGGVENAKESFAQDPVGVATDLASLFTAGGGVAAKVPLLAKVGGAVATVGRAVDPLNAVGKVVSPVAGFAGRRAADAIGSLGTHTGSESIQQAFTAGLNGGEKAQAFRENMRGNVPMADVVDQAREAVGNLRAERAKQYRSGMADISKDKTVLDMQPILDAYGSQRSMGSYKGKIINGSTVETQDKIGALLDDWAKSDPAEFHTPEGLDALKRAIGDIRDSTEFGSPSRKVADTAYNAVKAQIVRQAPGYAKVMKDYEAASDALSEIERSLSLGKKAAADTALRKLQSLMRNNVNSNYGNRIEAAKALEQNGAGNLLPSLAGQSLNTWSPRGLTGNVSAAGATIGSFVAPHVAIPYLASQSPRLVGEAVHAAGRVANKLARPSVGKNIRRTELTAYEADQINRAADFMRRPRNALAR